MLIAVVDQSTNRKTLLNPNAVVAVTKKSKGNGWIKIAGIKAELSVNESDMELVESYYKANGLLFPSEENEE